MSIKQGNNYIAAGGGTGAWGSITGTLSDQTDLQNALNAKYDASNPNGYTSNIGTVTSVNNTSPDSNGNVSLSIPTVDQTYSATSTNAQSGTAVASAISGKANDSDVVKLTGNQTITGRKTFQRTDGSVNYIKGTGLDITTAPSSNKHIYTDYIDKNNSRIGVIGASVLTSGNRRVYLQAGNEGSMGITTDGTNAFTFAPTPATSDNSTKIATTAYVKAQGYVTSSGTVEKANSVINQRDNTTLVKTWTGTKAQYDAIITKDANTLYNITDDTDVSLTILEALYPVGSVYITTASTCPLSTLITGSTWVAVSTGIVKAGNIPCKGNGMTLGITDGTNLAGMYSDDSTALTPMVSKYGSNIGENVTGASIRNKKTFGITTDSSKSGIVADTSSLTLSVNIFKRTA